jgi:hypothetical protein
MSQDVQTAENEGKQTPLFYCFIDPSFVMFSLPLSLSLKIFLTTIWNRGRMKSRRSQCLGMGSGLELSHWVRVPE